jgi:hypothetical protein
MLMKMIKKCNL